MNRLKIAQELLRVAETLIAGDYHYIYDPDHKKHPGGGYQKTEKGWQKGKEKVKELSDDFEEVQPTNGRQSFYGKAVVRHDTKGRQTLYSYGTPVLRKEKDGSYSRLWDGWSATTGSHIKSWAGISKKEWDKMPVRSQDYNPEKDNEKMYADKLQNVGFDITKLSPELRERVKDMDEEELQKFIGWLIMNKK